MTATRMFVLSTAATLFLAACNENTAPGQDSTDPRANDRDAAIVASADAPNKDTLVARELQAYAAWQSKNAAFWNGHLWDDYVGYGSAGRIDKASAIKEYVGADCTISSFALDDEEIRALSENAALLTYRLTLDGSCSGTPVPSSSRAAAVYVRDGTAWKAAFHAAAAIIDPASLAGAIQGQGNTTATAEPEEDSLGSNATTMLATERALWEAWRQRESEKLSGLMGTDISFINIFGTYLPNKKEALNDWDGNGCDVASVSVTNAKATMLSPTVGILTFNGAAIGSCFGQAIGPIWGTSIYVKDGNLWKWTFGINLPAQFQTSQP